MSDKSKGISLRKKRVKDKKKAAPTISAPRQISAPLPAGANVAAPSITSSRPSTESSRSRQNRGDVPRERPQRADKTADLVKRRYSQKITTLPSDFGNGPMPDMPQIPSQYRDKSQPRDVRPPPNGVEKRGGSMVDMKALNDPNLRAEQCEMPPRSPRHAHTDLLKMSPQSSQTPPKKTSAAFKTSYARRSTEPRQTCRPTSITTAPSSLGSAKRQRSSKAKCGPCGNSWRT